MTIHYPNRFKEALPAGFDGIFEWDWLESAFSGKIKPMDIDAIVERKGYFLCFETKANGKSLPVGQQIMFENLVTIAPNRVTLFILNGKTKDTITKFEHWFCIANGKLIKKIYTKQKHGVDAEFVWNKTNEWFQLANVFFDKSRLTKNLLKPKPNFVIISDTREQNPYLFSNIDPKVDVIHKGLPTGDYTLQGYEDKIIIERKNKSDLFGSFGQGRKRLQREFERLAEFDYAALVIECSLADIFLKPPAYTKMKPKSVLRSLTSWSIRYGVHCWPCPDRIFAQKITYILLFQYFKQNSSKD